MGTQSMSYESDVLDLAQKLTDKVSELVDSVETLDGNKWLGYADQIDALNSQLQNLLAPEEPEPEKASEKQPTSTGKK